MSNSDPRWRELIFGEGEVITDAVSFKERSHLIIPHTGEENHFLVSFKRDEIRFFVGSTGVSSLKRLEAFFQRVYSASSIETPYLEEKNAEEIYMTNGIRTSLVRDFYSPAFVRGVFDIPISTGLQEMNYKVTVRTGSQHRGKSRFNFVVRLGTTDPVGLSDAAKIVQAEVLNLRRESHWVLKQGRWKTSDILLRNPGNLINFIRIPSERPPA